MGVGFGPFEQRTGNPRWQEAPNVDLGKVSIEDTWRPLTVCMVVLGLLF